ncbi:MAG: electron transfer flavoprotein subunit beta/FixA family protein [Lachnospiraceae bacterium]|nr:electron transfer flavoprotein subunit beta/FixA family protein [Lachnospiraceae bacterium]
MKIAVCIKQVPVSGQVRMDPVTHSLIRNNTEMGMNVADLNALTEAIQLKKQMGGSIDVFTMGVSDAKSVLYTALAMGADEGYLVTDRHFAGGDSLGTAKVLVKALEYTGKYDLVVCGCIASDGATGQVGPMIAQRMDIASVTEVKKISNVESSSLDVHKIWQGKLVHLKLRLPALITVSLGCNTPILPTLRNQMKAKKKVIHEITNEELQIESDAIGLSGAKSMVTETLLIEKTGKRSQMLTGSFDEIADQVLNLIKEAKH